MKFKLIVVCLSAVIGINFLLWYFIPSPTPQIVKVSNSSEQLRPNQSTKQSITCEELLPNYLHSLSYSSATIDEVEVMLEGQAEVVNLQWPFDDFRALSWHINDTENYYAVDFHNETLMSATVSIWESRPAGQKIIDCFGNPDLYEATYELGIEYPFINTKFWYMDRGIVVTSILDAREKLNANSQFNGLYIMKPTTPERMAEWIYRYMEESKREKLVNSLQKRLKPWPGTWEQIEIMDCMLPDSDC